MKRFQASGPRRLGRLGLAAAWCVAVGGSLCPVSSQMLPDGPPPVAAADTLVAQLAIPEGSPAPREISVAPDSVPFGAVVWVRLEWTPGVNLPDPQSVSFDVDWLGAAGEEDRDANQSAWVAEAPERRLAVPFRTYQTAPFRLAADSAVSGVMQASGRVVEAGRLAPVRQPRPWSGGWTTLVVLVLAATILLLAIWWLIWGRGRESSDSWRDWQAFPCGWVKASVTLRDLLAGDDLARGDGRRFLDRLAAATRGFVGEHYRIPALEMTGQEIVNACLQVGYLPGRPRRFAQIIDLADRYRYDRGQPDTALCLDQARNFFEQMAAVRIIPRQTVLPARELLQAEQAWATVAARLGASPTGQPGWAKAGGE